MGSFPLIDYVIEFALTIWAACSVRQIDQHVVWGIYSGALCNLFFLAWWLYTGQYGFLTGDLVFTLMYAERIYRRW